MARAMDESTPNERRRKADCLRGRLTWLENELMRRFRGNERLKGDEHHIEKEIVELRKLIGKLESVEGGHTPKRKRRR